MKNIYKVSKLIFIPCLALLAGCMSTETTFDHQAYERASKLQAQINTQQQTDYQNRWQQEYVEIPVILSIKNTLSFVREDGYNAAERGTYVSLLIDGDRVLDKQIRMKKQNDTLLGRARIPVGLKNIKAILYFRAKLKSGNTGTSFRGNEAIEIGKGTKEIHIVFGASDISGIPGLLQKGDFDLNIATKN